MVDILRPSTITEEILLHVGKTPLVELTKVGAGLPGRVFAKVETLNPTGSIKDRMAIYMADRARERGELRPGYTIVEATSGNTGISFSMVAAVRGYRMIAVMPENMSEERRHLMRLLGAEFELTPAQDSLPGAIRRTEEIAREQDRVWAPRQFANPDNIRAHQETSGREIVEALDRVDAFVAGWGTAGTLMGVARALRGRFRRCRIVGLEAAESPHFIQGISDDLVPDLYDESLVDDSLEIASEDAIRMAARLAREEGLLVGPSAGANVIGALRLAEREGVVVTVLPDRAERYLSMSRE
jgi:cysteine synthase A